METEHEIKSSNNQNKVIIGAIVVGVVILVGGLLVNFRNSSDQAGETREATGFSENAPKVAGASNVTETPDGSMDVGIKVIKIEAGSFYYNPKEIKVKVGENVKIELTAKDMMHDFNIDELGVDGPVIKACETTTIEFTAEKPVEYEYYCSVGQHRANGQVGTLIVE